MLGSRVEALLKKYQSLQAEHAILRETAAAQKQTIESLTNRIASLEEDLVSVQMGRAVLSAEEKARMRRQLDQVISDIDKILGSLHD